jgi:hypothetical protein
MKARIFAEENRKLSDRVGSRWLMGAGMTLLSISLLLYQRGSTGSARKDGARPLTKKESPPAAAPGGFLERRATPGD